MPRRLLVGVVVSAKCAKTITVKVEKRIPHPLYGKVVTSTNKYAAHDESGACKEGDVVAIRECRPFSKTKKWEVIEKKQTA